MRFLLDGMLGKLTRWLRMLGYDAIYANDMSDQDLLALAKRESLTLLTSDEELYRTAAMRHVDAFLVEGRSEPERLASLATRYGLRLEIDTTISRCPTCGGSLKEVPREAVQGSVPDTTFKVYRSFWACTNPTCAKVYWQGSHWRRIEQTLEETKKIVGSQTAATTRGRAKPRRGANASETGAVGSNNLP
jgi:uncharacterized protein with PIN domain